MTFHISTALLVAVGIILCILAFKWLFADWIDKRNMRWVRRKHKQGYFEPPKSFKPIEEAKKAGKLASDYEPPKSFKPPQ